MNKLRFIINNYIDNTILSAVPTMDVNLPVDNVKESSRSKVTRSVDNSNQEIKGYFNAAKDVSAIVIGRHNFTLDMQYKISLYNNTSIDTSFANTGGTESANDDFYIAGSHASLFPATQVFDVIGDTSNTDACNGGTNNTLPAQDVLNVNTDKKTK